MVKVRPNTINKMRELEVLKDELKVAGSDAPSGEGSSPVVSREVLQGLYAFSQTETYIPNPVVDVSIVPLVLKFYSLFVVRVLSQKIILATLISMYRLCYLKEQLIYRVRFIIIIIGTSTLDVSQSRVWPRLQRNWVLIMLKLWYVQSMGFSWNLSKSWMLLPLRPVSNLRKKEHSL